VLARIAVNPHLSKKYVTKCQTGSPTSMDLLVHLLFCTDVKQGIRKEHGTCKGFYDEGVDENIGN
jgi:hypothetical protein